MPKTTEIKIDTFEDQDILKKNIKIHGFNGLMPLKSRLSKDRDGYKGKLDVKSLRIAISEAFNQNLLPTQLFELAEPQAVLDEVLPFVIEKWHEQSPMKYLTSLKYLILAETDYRNPNLDFIQFQAALNKRQLSWFKKDYYEELYNRMSKVA